MRIARSDRGGGRGAVSGRSIACKAVQTIGLTAVLLTFGLITRPVARFLSGLYGFHAVLMAFPSSFATAAFLRKGKGFPVCLGSFALFSFVLFATNPVMGLSSFAPMVAAALVRAAAVGLSCETRGLLTGFVFGALYYPCTLAFSAMLGGAIFSFSGNALPKLVVSALLGIALAAFGALLGAGASLRREGD